MRFGLTAPHTILEKPVQISVIDAGMEVATSKLVELRERPVKSPSSYQQPLPPQIACIDYRVRYPL